MPQTGRACDYVLWGCPRPTAGISLRGPTRSGAPRRGRRSNLNAASARLLRFARNDRTSRVPCLRFLRRHARIHEVKTWLRARSHGTQPYGVPTNARRRPGRMLLVREPGAEIGFVSRHPLGRESAVTPCPPATCPRSGSGEIGFVLRNSSIIACPLVAPSSRVPQENPPGAMVEEVGRPCPTSAGTGERASHAGSPRTAPATRGVAPAGSPLPDPDHAPGVGPLSPGARGAGARGRCARP